MVTPGGLGFHSRLLNRHSVYGSFLSHIALFVPLPLLCSILVLILLPYCPSHLPGFMSFPYTFYLNPDSCTVSFCPSSLPWFLSKLSFFFHFDFMPAFLPFCPTCLQSQSPLFNLSGFFLLSLPSFVFLISLSLPTSWLLATFPSSLSFHLFNAVSSRF